MSEIREKSDFQENWLNYEINFPCILITDDGMMSVVHYSEDSIAYDARGHQYLLTGCTNW